MRRTFSLQMHATEDLLLDPCPSDEAWCHWCGSPIGLDEAWRALKARRAAQSTNPDPHSRYCTRLDPRSC